MQQFALVDRFIPELLERERLLRARVSIAFSLALVGWAPVFALLCGLVCGTSSAVAILLAGLVGGSAPFVLRRTGSLIAAASLHALAFYGVSAYMASISGGLLSTALSWAAVLPLFAAGMGGFRFGAFWAGAVVAEVAVFLGLHIVGIDLQNELTPRALLVLNAAGLSAISLLLFSVAVLYERVHRAAVARLEQANGELADARDEARAASQTKTAFLANMSHEIRTPMNGVLGMTSLLAETPLDEEQRDYVDTLRRSSQTLLALIDDVLDLSKLEAGKVELRSRPFSLRDLLEEVVELFSGLAYEKEIELMSFIAPDVPDAFVGDPDRVRQILANFLSNGVKFTDQGEVVLWALVDGADADALSLRFEVQDTGIGVPEEALDTLFLPFSQADSSMTRRHGGTGLGLAIARSLAERMGGEVGVSSTPGRGSTFWLTLTLPLAPPSSLSSVERRDRLRLEGRRFLVVDASAEVRQSVAALLASWGAEVDGASADEDALLYLASAQVERRPFDGVLLEAKSASLALVSHLRSREIPAIALVDGNALLPRLPLYMRRLRKPVRRAQLREQLSSLLYPRREGDKEPAAESALPAPLGSAGARVLLVEDNPVNQLVAMRLLERLGLDVHVARTGREALEALDREDSDYELILMDCQMPELDGYETTRQIRAKEGGGRSIPIIAMTAHALAGDRDRCLAAGMDDYLAKPIDVNRLRHMLERWTRPPRPSPARSLSDPTES